MEDYGIKTILDMLRTDSSCVQDCEMIESKWFHMDRSKSARILLSGISSNHPSPPRRAANSSPLPELRRRFSAINTGERSLSSAALLCVHIRKL